jgi:general secretion pathway protein J
MTNFHPTYRGFTLLEILIAISVFAVFSAMAYGGLMRLLDSRARIEAERAYWRDLSLGFARIEQDLTMARNRIARRTDGDDEGQPFHGWEPEVVLIEDPRLEFTRATSITSDSKQSDLQRIGYRHQDGKLLRMVWPVLDRAPTTKPVGTVLLRDVDDFRLRYYQAQNEQWHKGWPVGGIGSVNQSAPLPDAVEVTVVLKGRGEFTRTFLVGRDK